MTMIETLESPSKRTIRAVVYTVVSKLHEVDNLLMELSEHLPLPPDVSEMWELRRPMSFSANLHGSLEAVRRDCIHEAVETLLLAVRHDEESLRIAFLKQQEGQKTAVYPSGYPNRPPASEAGRKETPLC
ncbi:MAG: hypothetical protein HC794_08055 [Nitrospiraceae bacterium]|nr:hypothetical protein [Nitrospiraceae bacterium]